MTDTTDLIQRLRAYQQADEEGVIVKVSRQACDEAADALEQQAAQIEALRADAERYRWLRRTTNAVTSKGERIDVRNNPELWDSAIDAALRQDQPTKPNHFPDAGKMVQPAGEGDK